MRQLLLGGSESFLLSARVALEAHGIEYAPASAASGMLGATPLGGLMVHDDDYARACEVIAGLQNSSAMSEDPVRNSPVFAVVVKAIVSGIICIWLSLVLHGR